ncbi:kinesin light chain, putative [Ricinus communis]|uniref:Kinesin light chain, putative n=1 Tax=Ricinus communis TaxID=3988 RepID=B9T2R5_RICCO|nr:kinesin light chain, putative [Ricinus communis]
MNYKDGYIWSIIAGQAAIILGINANPVLANAPNESNSETESEGANVIGLRKIEDGSVISNIHTSKWRIFTDNGRAYFLQGKLDEAEKFFLSALEEAKKGFGNREPHVASACNNLAELYRVKKAFDKAEPLYLEAVNILEESFGPDDIRVGAAFHNLGQFYLMQRKLEEARNCYEIKRHVLGHDHTDYADTMYHLGTVLYLQGKEKDAEDLIQDSIQILEGAGQGESIMCIRRLRYLSQIYLKSNRVAEAENVQRKVLHIMELLKGWNSMDTVITAESLALTLQAAGSLKEARELLERCLDARKTLLPQDHIQIGANMLHIARVVMLNANRLRKISISEAIAELDKAKDLLYNSTRIARQVLKKLRNQKGSREKNAASEETRREGHAALIILLQSLDALAHVEITKEELQESTHPSAVEAESALFQCISAYKQFESERSISDSPEVKAEYLSCLKRLSTLISDSAVKEIKLSGKPSLQELNDEIKRIQGAISHHNRSKFRCGMS